MPQVSLFEDGSGAGRLVEAADADGWVWIELIFRGS
jgi:hypothetical protein